MTIPCSNLLVRRNASGKWCFTHQPEENPDKSKKNDLWDRWPRYGGGGLIHLVDSKGDEVGDRIVLREHLPGYSDHASESTAGSLWEEDAFAFIYKGRTKAQLYGVVYPWWGIGVPLVIDLVNLVPLGVGSYDLLAIQEAYRKRIRSGVLNMVECMNKGVAVQREVNTSQGEYAYPTAYLHHAGILQMTELVSELKKLKKIPKELDRYESVRKAATPTLHRLGVNEEQQLIDAAACGDTAKMKQLLTTAEVNWQTGVAGANDQDHYSYRRGDKTALHSAVQNDHLEAVELLLEQPDIATNHQDHNGETPFYLPRQMDALIKLLDYVEVACPKSRIFKDRSHIDYWVNSTHNRKGHTVLESFCFGNKKTLVEELLRRGADPNRGGWGGRTSLHVACEAGHSDIVQLLLNAGAKFNGKADPKEKDANGKYVGVGKTPLYEAVEAGHTEVVQILLTQKGVDVNAMPKEKRWKGNLLDPALCVACKGGDPSLMRLLLDYPGLDSLSIEAALTQSVECGNKESVRIFLDHQAVGLSPVKAALMVAAKQGDLKMTEMLLEHKSIHPVCSIIPALGLACENNHVDVVTILLGNLDVGLWTQSGLHLYCAAQRQHMELCRLLLEHGASTRYQDQHGWTALKLAVDNGDEEMARLFLEHGGDVNAADVSGWTALHWACKKGNVNLITMLLEHGADGDHKSKEGHTPLDTARTWEQLDAVCFLVLRLTRELQASDPAVALKLEGRSDSDKDHDGSKSCGSAVSRLLFGGAMH